MKRTPLVALAAALAAIGLVAAGLAWLLDVQKPPPGASRAERLYVGLCATCHGLDGHGSWRAALFLIRPGDLGDRTRMSREPDRYLFEIIKNGGAPFGRPGMPSFGYLSDADIEALVQYVRGLAARRQERTGRAGGDGPSAIAPFGSSPERSRHRALARRAVPGPRAGRGRHRGSPDRRRQPSAPWAPSPAR